MRQSSTSRLKKNSLQRLEHWKLEDAKAKLSEVVRLATSRGPQVVTIRGKEAAVVLSPREFERLMPQQKPEKSMFEFLRSLSIGDLDLTRERDKGREIEL